MASVCTPAALKFSSAVAATRPVASKNASASRHLASPFWVKFSVPSFKFLTSQPSKISIPCVCSSVFTLSFTSSSSFFSTPERATIATFEPNSANIEANSSPMYPPPTIARRFGSVFRFKIPVLSKAKFELTSKLGFSLTEPVFITIVGAVSTLFEPSTAATSTLFLSTNLAVPFITSMFALPSSIAKFLALRAEISLSFFSTLSVKYSPKTLLLTYFASLLKFTSFLVGMQPMFMHVPPYICADFSITATFLFKFAAFTARVLPALPKPIITIS